MAMKRLILLFLVAASFVLSGTTSFAQAPPGTRQLLLFWNAERRDNFTTATAVGEASAGDANYAFVRTEGHVFTQNVAGTVPLLLYWNADRQDNFTTATAEGRRDAEAAGYKFVRVEGYVYEKEHRGTVPLLLYWNAERGDNFTTATAEGKRDAEAAGYQFVRVEGYVFPESEPAQELSRDEVVRASRRALELRAAGKYAEAKALHERILPATRRIFGAESQDAANITGSLALCHQDLGEYAKAEPLLRRALELHQKNGAAQHVSTACNNLGLLYRDMGDYAKAEALLQRALQLDEQIGRGERESGPTHNNLAGLYQTQGQYAKAETHFLRSLRIHETKDGATHEDVAQLHNNLGMLYMEMGQYARAESGFRRSLQIYEARLGKDHAHVAFPLNNLGLLYQRFAHYSKAEAHLQRGLQINEASRGKNHPEVATSLGNLGILYQDLGQFAKAQSHLLRSLEINEASFGKAHLAVATALNNLGQLYHDQGQYTKAEEFLVRAQQTNEQALGKDHAAVATSLGNLGNLYRDLCRYEKAETALLRDLKICEARLPKDHVETAAALQLLGVYYEELGQYAKAEAHCQKALKMRQVLLGNTHPQIASSLGNLASLHRKIGQYAKAESSCRRSLQMFEALFGKNHPNVASTLHALASLNMDMGQFENAVALCERSVQIYEAVAGKQTDLAGARTTLARLYDALGQHQKAETMLQQSLQTFEAVFGKEHIEVALTLRDLADVELRLGQYAKAGPRFRRSLEIFEARLGSDHPSVASTRHKLGTLHQNLGEFAEAEQLLQGALQLRVAKLGPDHPDVAVTLAHLAANSAARKNWAEAVQREHKARRIMSRYLAELLPSLSEKEQLSLLEANVNRAFHKALSLGWSTPPEAGAASAEWLLNGKALTHQSLAEQQLLARDARDSAARQLVEDLQQVRARLAAHIHRAPKPGLEQEYQKQMQELRAAEQDLGQKLARSVGRPYRSHPWVTLDELRTKLGPKTAFVDIARFPVWDFNANKFVGPRYVAWITLPGAGQVQVIDLGETDAIDQLVAQTSKALGDAEPIRRLGEPDALAALQKPLGELSAKVLHPLLPTLASFEEWIVCPDGALWLTPWSALLLPDPPVPPLAKGGNIEAPPLTKGGLGGVKFAVEKYLIRHVVSGRDLVLDLSKTKGASAYVFADPDYDLAPAKLATRAGMSNFLGQRLHGSIDKWRYSFEFRDNDVIVRDDMGGSGILGQGTWQLQGNLLTFETRVAAFAGAITANEIRGKRAKRNADGSVTRDTFRIELPRANPDDVRAVGSFRSALATVKGLPFTAVEAELIRPRLAQWLGSEPKVFLEDKASEALVKSIKNPRVLTLATHAYFLPQQEVEAKDRIGLDLGEGKRSVALFDKKGEPIENPLLRCGLLLAGCNKRADARSGEDDGILTGLEIVGMNLNGCELVVLSACETGLGDVRNGEGVAGLRQAFQLAGAKAVLASLWQVDDRETAYLMNAFYGELTQGKSQAAALREAQLQRIAARRNQFGAAHPFFWAAFTLTSRGTD